MRKHVCGRIQIAKAKISRRISGSLIKAFPLQNSLDTITKTRLFKYIENFTAKNWKYSEKNSDIFLLSAHNIDCGHSLEPPRRGGSNECPQSLFLNRNKTNNVYSCKPQFYYIKLGFKGVNIIQACFRDATECMNGE